MGEAGEVKPGVCVSGPDKSLLFFKISDIFDFVSLRLIYVVQSVGILES